MKVQKTGHTSPSICIVSASQAEVVQEATSSMGACYVYTKSTNDCYESDGVERFKWQSEYFFPPKLQSLLQRFILSAQCEATPSVHLETCRYPVEHG